MTKRKLDLKVMKNLSSFPSLPTLVGVNVDEKPNYIAIASSAGCATTRWRLGGTPAVLAERFDENRTFSGTNPEPGSYASSTSAGWRAAGRSTKASLFETFYGETKTAPYDRPSVP